MTQCYISEHEVINEMDSYRGCYKSGKRVKYYCVDILKCPVYDTCIKVDKNE
ncbi:hypothetical protein ES702_01437 [subsurface metagenome]